jgi:SnoaL-like protein
MTQTKIDETIASYAAAWNESNEAPRRQLLEKAWATNGTYTDPTAHVEGREALVQHIAGFLESMPGARIVATSHTDSHHGALRFSWRLIQPDGTAIEGMDFGELDGDGRIKRIVGFFGPFTPLDR